jgi:hypothetical protein
VGYELYYEGRVTFDPPVSLSGPGEEDLLPDLTQFFTPVFEEADGTSTGRHVTGFQVDEKIYNSAKSWPWQQDLAAIEEFARRHRVTLTAQLRWQGDGFPPNPAEDRGHIVFDLYGEHHQIPDSENNDQTVETHRRRSCTCYTDPHPDPAPHPVPVPELAPVSVSVHPVVGPLTPIRSGQLTDHAAHCTEHGQICFIPDENLARALRNEHIARHHS